MTTMRERIAELLWGYAEAIDDDTLERWPGFFIEDAVYQITSRASCDAGLPIGIMLCEGRGMMEDRVNALRTANIYEPHRYRHMLGRPHIKTASGVTAVRTSFLVHRIAQDGETVLFASGDYRDEVVEEGPVLRFKSRRVVLDSPRVDVLLVVPL
ncbi:MAG: aromatic-ring-hydroxylating dioxygenase subunit beta [Acetobacteraceae bacterium]|nr:aromatic-ring-hydroxylating dioxygenase subunit beta [Acetobacteraceae bacterium]